MNTAPLPDLVVSQHRQVLAVLADPFFAVPAPHPDRAPFGTVSWLRQNVARFSSGLAHQRRRAVVADLLVDISPDELRRLAHTRTAAVIERFAGQPFDVMTTVARQVPLTLLGSCLGVDDPDLVSTVALVAAAYHPGSACDGADEAVRRLAEQLGPDDPELVANRVGLLIQAWDATAGLIGNTVALALRGEAAWPVEVLAVEALRYAPPVRGTRRVASQDTDLDGIPITEGMLLLLDFAAANRDVSVFADPNRFVPGRPRRGEHLTFGAGLRPCPGTGHAMALACGVLDVLLSRCELVGQPAPLVPTRLEVRAT